MVGHYINSLLQKIGDILVRSAGSGSPTILLYAQLDEGYVSPAIFTDRGDHLAYSDLLNEISDPLITLWKEQSARDKWEEMEYLIEDNKFTVNYVYSEDIDHDADPFERRNAIVKRYFGDKATVYPSLEDLSGSQTFKL